MTHRNAPAEIRLRSLGPLDAAAPVYVELIETRGQQESLRSCLLSCREASELLRWGRTPTIKPYMDRQVVLDIARLIGTGQMRYDQDNTAALA